MKNSIMNQIRDKAIWLVLVVLFIAFAAANDKFVSANNLFTIARQVSMFGIAAVGMTFVILIGGIDLATGSIITLVNVVAAYLMVKMNFSIIAAIITSLMLATDRCPERIHGRQDQDARHHRHLCHPDHL
jgi:ribose transport system permease protein